jgi:HK97 family phage prohead protease
MLHKQFELLEIKAEGDDGSFTALVSTFNNVDRVGDRIMPGAYKNSLEQRRVTGDPLPIIFAHKWDDPWAHIGTAQPGDVVETEKGLLVKGYLDVAENPLAAQVHRLMKRRSLREFSIGFNVPKGGERRAKDGANEIREIDLAECGPCLKGIDPKTELHAVKAALDAVSHPVEKELQDLRARVETLEGLVRGKAITDQTPAVTGGSSVDSLRRDSDMLAASVALGNVPTAATPARSRQDPDDDLKRRSRDLMLQLLSP